jgi:hypothetical protein
VIENRDVGLLAWEDPDEVCDQADDVKGGRFVPRRDDTKV